MTTVRGNALLLASALTLFAGLATCSENPAAGTAVPVTEEQVTGIVENMLTGYNSGGHAGLA